MRRDGNSAFISRGTGGELGGDGKLRSSVAGRDADGRSDGTRTGLMNGALHSVHQSQFPSRPTSCPVPFEFLEKL